ncbi:MAG: TadE/TadG family type IV pilus assembly protein, partial [Pseudomonadota bacterium]
MELLVSLPLLLGVMLITANYGIALSTREALDSATRDAARLLARSPAELGVVDGATVPVFFTYFEDEARLLIANRMGVDLADVTFSATVERIPTVECLRTDFYKITVATQVTVTQLGSEITMT